MSHAQPPKRVVSFRLHKSGRKLEDVVALFQFSLMKTELQLKNNKSSNMYASKSSFKNAFYLPN